MYGCMNVVRQHNGDDYHEANSQHALAVMATH
jgi:hypothetical protein